MLVQNQQVATNKSSDDDSSNNKTSDLQAMMHILKANVAVGVLAMPSAFKNVGLWLGFILVPLIGFTCVHCMNILIHCHNHLCDKFNYEALDYDQVAALGLACGPKIARRLAKRAHVVILSMLMFTQIGFCCVYILFVVENIQISMLSLFQINYPATTYMCVIFPIIWLTSCTSNLKHLAAISTLANAMQLTGLSLIFFDLVQPVRHMRTSLVEGASTSNQSVVEPAAGARVEVELLWSKQVVAGLPLFFATCVYAFEGIGVVLPVVKEMREPSRISGLSGVLNTAMSLVAILYMGMGFFGYAKYGQLVKSSITFNLPETTLYDLVRLVFAAAIGLSYSLQFYVPWTIMWPFIDEALFYSYRPREQRDKLDILNKLRPDNEWALLSGTGSEDESNKLPDDEKGGGADRERLRRAAEKPAQGERDDADEEGQTSIRRSFAPSFDLHSTATTFATSYTLSSYLQQPAFKGQLQLQLQLQHQTANHSGTGAAESERPQQVVVGERRADNNPDESSLVADKRNWHLFYGSMDEPGNQPEAKAEAHPAGDEQLRLLRQRAADRSSGELNLLRGQQKRRNRYAELRNNQDDDDDDQLPEVEWRPPPKSMRGLRKLVRYSVILLTVSFTFVAAALIPRLDLFISLIGALASSCLAIIFPAIIETCTFWRLHEAPGDEHELAPLLGSRPLFLAKNLLLVLFGLAGLVTGSWVSMAQLCDSMRS